MAVAAALASQHLGAPASDAAENKVIWLDAMNLNAATRTCCIAMSRYHAWTPFPSRRARCRR